MSEEKDIEKAKLEVEKQRINLDHKTERQKIFLEFLFRRREFKIEKKKIDLELSRPWWQQSVPWLAPTASALVAILALIGTNWQSERARIAEMAESRIARAVEEQTRIDALKADREARKQEADDNITSLREQRETEIILQATKDVSLEQARSNILFFSKLGYLTSKNTSEIEKILEENTPRTGSSGALGYPDCPEIWKGLLVRGIRPSNSPGMSLHVGANRVDPERYEGENQDNLLRAVNDARGMRKLARQAGYSSAILIDDHARTDCILSAIRQAAEMLRSGEYFLLTFSGFGNRIPDFTGEEPDGADETWMLYDGQLSDDDLYQALRDFSEGVRVTIIVDTSFGIQLRPPQGAPDILAQVLILGAAEEDQVVYETDLQSYNYSEFTNRILHVWDNGAFTGSYQELYEEIREGFPGRSMPFLRNIGPTELAFASARAFRLSNGPP